MKTAFAIAKFLVYVLVLWPLACALDALIFFVPTAAVTGFVAWLIGASSPRETALLVGAIVGSLWGVGQYGWKWLKFFEVAGEALTKRRIEALEREP